MKKRILKIFEDKGILLDPGAIDELSAAKDAMKCVDAILSDPERPLVVTKADVQYYLTCQPVKPKATPPKTAPEPRVALPSIEAEPGEIRILKDITGDSTCVGNVIDFAKLFNDRFQTLKKILARRRELAGMMSIDRARKIQKDVRFVGIVNDSRTTKNGHTILDIEDEDDRIQVLIMKGAKKGMDAFIKDEVLGIVGSLSKDGELVIAKDVIRPEVPLNNSMAPNGSNAIVAFVSDIHVGSSEFLPDAWNRFVAWLNKNPVAKGIAYIIMPGDLVDGIGIYPGQEDELSIEDVYEQYQEFARLVAAVPHRIKIVMMPGNHDAVRLAEPQPALPKEVSSMFDSRVTFVGNPCYMEIEGRTILAYHGRSMDDFAGNIPNMSQMRPAEIMKEMLRRRHLAPIYGDRTALAPEQRDYLVIDRVPDIFVTGHVHRCAIGEYRGIKMINASAWQGQTEYQRMRNQVPEPARVPMIDLGTGDIWVEDFSSS
ncbi:MAG: hypothetical protein A3K60_05265 [Euryarchaeota archaeon RBG_19FT_COMBO_56_21]|nr:MAG: hypothetical protein A3K60_05265 [Euryarchaeota archaeon RBG_19FT_COMBO_56_21]